MPNAAGILPTPKGSEDDREITHPFQLSLCINPHIQDILRMQIKCLKIPAALNVGLEFHSALKGNVEKEKTQLPECQRKARVH